MNVIKSFLKTVWANKTMLILYTAIFIILLGLQTRGGTSQMPTDFVESQARVGIILKSSSETALALKEYLQDDLGEGALLEELPDDLAAARESIFMGNYDAILRIPEDFDKKLQNKKQAVQLIINPKSYEGNLMENRIDGFLGFLQMTEENGQYDIAKVREILKIKSEASLVRRSGTSQSDSEREMLRYFLNTAGYIVMAIYIAVIGNSMSSFNQLKVKKRIVASSKKTMRFQIELYIAQLLVGAIITGTIMIFMPIFLGKGISANGEIKKYLLNLSVFSLVMMAFTFMINNLTNSDSAKSALSTIVSLGSAFVSGVIIPQEILSAKVLAVAKFFPTYYFVRINDKVIPDTDFMIRNLGIQILFGILFLALSIYFAQKRRITE